MREELQRSKHKAYPETSYSPAYGCLLPPAAEGTWQLLLLKQVQQIAIRRHKVAPAALAVGSSAEPRWGCSARCRTPAPPNSPASPAHSAARASSALRPPLQAMTLPRGWPSSRVALVKRRGASCWVPGAHGKRRVLCCASQAPTAEQIRTRGEGVAVSAVASSVRGGPLHVRVAPAGTWTYHH